MILLPYKMGRCVNIMRNSRKKIKVFLFVLISILTISIGYASISAINLLINGNGTVSVNQNNFKVHFTEAKEITGTTGVSGTTIIESNDTIASFNVTGLTKVGDYAEAKYTVSNDSNTVGAEISLNVTTTNTEFFKVTETIDDNKLQAGEETLATVKVEMIKTPITDSVTTSVTAKLIANPLDNGAATGGDSASAEPIPNPVSFATDSWATIKKAVQDNNTNAYNVGDTKEVTLNGTDYTVRIANKTTGEHCGDEDTAYSQTACGFVVEFAEIVEKRAMNSTNTNVGGWPATEMRTYLNGTFYNSLPSDLQAAIKPLSSEEVWGIDDGGNSFYDTAYGTSHQLEYYSNNGVTYSTRSYRGTNLDKANKQYNSSNTWWWLRPAHSNNGDIFAFVGNSGGWASTDAVNTGGVAPAFRIG